MVLDDSEVLAAIGKKARERAERLFRVERMVREHRELFEEVTGR